MSPEYFHSRLSFSEAVLFIKGVDRRNRSLLSASSFLGNCMVAIWGAKGDCTPEGLKKDPIFDYEVKKDVEGPTPEEREALAKMAKQANAFFNRNRKETTNNKKVQ